MTPAAKYLRVAALIVVGLCVAYRLFWYFTPWWPLFIRKGYIIEIVLMLVIMILMWKRPLIAAVALVALAVWMALGIIVDSIHPRVVSSPPSLVDRLLDLKEIILLSLASLLLLASRLAMPRPHQDTQKSDVSKPSPDVH